MVTIILVQQIIMGSLLKPRANLMLVSATISVITKYLIPASNEVALTKAHAGVNTGFCHWNCVCFVTTD